MKKAFLFLVILMSISVSIFSCRMDRERQMEYFLQALEKYQEWDFQAAIDILENNIRRIDRGYFFYFYRGFFTQQQNFQMFMPLAMKDYHRAYEFNLDSFFVNNAIGFGYLVMGDYERAIPFLERAYELFSLESEAPSPYWSLAEAYFRVGRLEEALRVNARAIETRGDQWDYFQRGEILSQITGDINDLLEHYNIAREIAPDDFALQRDFALRLIRMGYIEKAYELYTEWLVGHEDFFDWCLADMAYIHMLKGNWDRSIELLKRAMRINNTQVLTLQYVSFYHFFRGDYNEAFHYEARS
ncbi:MAG: tetratricopeptide repeat protein [Treponema sp.]|nr:tetratricopeptide repeat protein [Treponema sp.]